MPEWSIGAVSKTAVRKNRGFESLFFLKMQKEHKREMLALLATMGKMAELLPKLADPAEQIQDLMAACQCLKENLEGENATGCAGALQAIQACVTPGKAGDYPSLHMLSTHIKHLESTFNSEINTRREVVFLPYKASMWDSLESIYLAAKEDPDCDAFVMPIPYYDIKGGKYTEMHWETDYPKNIPLIDFRKYDIAQRRPDMIFIHNPYDDCNTLTSVHPDYYSSKLKNLTKCLVYVPYHTQRWTINPDTRFPDNYNWTPVYFNAHKIIFQTEEAKKVTVTGFKRYFGMQYGDPDRRFVALGCPKIDKVVNAKVEDFEVPDEWKKLMENKRVVFYNTSIAAILSGNEEYLNKLEYVLEEFKKQRDVILLWRPHPLSVNTFETMRPMLLDRYLNIVKKYKDENYGIYDDSSDLNRAIVLSDAYYGDDSSIMALWGFTGKPLMIQSLDGPDIQSRLKFGGFKIDSTGNAWAWHDISNGFFKIDIINNKASLVTTCDKKELVSLPPFCGIVEKTDGKLLNFANCSDFIMEFDPQTNEKHYIEPDIKHKINPIGWAMWVGPYEYNGNYYCFCGYSDSVIVLKKDGSVVYHSQIYKRIGLKMRNNIMTKLLIFALMLDENDKPIFFDNYPTSLPKDFKWSGNMFCLFQESDTIIRYNLETQQIIKIFNNKRFANVVQGMHDGESIWFTAREPLALLKVDLGKKTVTEFKNFPENFSPASQELANYDALYLVNCDSYILLFPALANMILRFDKTSETFEEFKGMPMLVDWTANKWKYGGAFRFGKSVFVPAHFNRILYELKLETGEVHEHIFECGKEDYEKYLKGNFWHLEPEIKPEQFYAREQNLINAFHEFIENFPKEVKGQKEAFSILAVNSNGTAGKAIYAALKTSP